MHSPPSDRPGSAPADRRRDRALLGILTLLALGVAGYALVTYVPTLFGRAGGDVAPLPNARSHPKLLAWHVISGVVALVAGTMQVLLLARPTPRPTWHRRIGMVYVVAVALSGGSGLLLAPSAAGGPAGQLGFALLALLWLGTTGIGVLESTRGNRAGHRRAMVRSFALTAAAISLRLQLPLSLAIGFEFGQAYPWIAWTCWVPNLLFAEGWLRRR